MKMSSTWNFCLLLMTPMISDASGFGFLNFLSGKALNCPVDFKLISRQNSALHQVNLQLRLDQWRLEQEIKETKENLRHLQREKEDADRLFIETWKINQYLKALNHQLIGNPNGQGCLQGSKPYKNKCVQLYFIHGPKEDAKSFCGSRGAKMFQTSLDEVPKLLEALNVSDKYYGLSFFIDEVTYDTKRKKFYYTNGSPFLTSNDVTLLAENPGKCIQFDSFKGKHRLSTKPCESKNLYAVCELNFNDI